MAEAEAQLARTHQDVVRYEPLVAKNAISREEYETAVALEKAAARRRRRGEGHGRAGRDRPLLHARSSRPTTAWSGKTEVYAGTLVGRGQSTLLTRISRIDPIHVRFSFPERDYLALRAQARQRRCARSRAPSVPFELLLADGSVHPQPGKLVFVDRNVDARTGTIMAEAAFPNPGEIVRPGPVRARARARSSSARARSSCRSAPCRSCRASSA